MIRCPKCGRFARLTTYWITGEQISKVNGMCTHCGRIHPVWDSYEDLAGWWES